LRNLHGIGFGDSSASRSAPCRSRVATWRGQSEKRMRRCGPLAGGPADAVRVRVWVSRVASSSPRASRVLAEPRPLSVVYRAPASLPTSALHIDGYHGKPTCRVQAYTIIYRKSNAKSPICQARRITQQTCGWRRASPPSPLCRCRQRRRVVVPWPWRRADCPR
jgi:hypothetical protein